MQSSGFHPVEPHRQPATQRLALRWLLRGLSQHLWLSWRASPSCPPRPTAHGQFPQAAGRGLGQVPGRVLLTSVSTSEQFLGQGPPWQDKRSIDGCYHYC